METNFVHLIFPPMLSSILMSKSSVWFQSLKYFGSSILDLLELKLEIEDIKVNFTKLLKNTLTIKDQSQMNNYGISK